MFIPFTSLIRPSFKNGVLSSFGGRDIVDIIAKNRCFTGCLTQDEYVRVSSCSSGAGRLDPLQPSLVWHKLSLRLDRLLKYIPELILNS